MYHGVLSRFSCIFSCHLRSHGVPITDPRTLKPSTIVIFVPSNIFFFTMSWLLVGFTLYPKAFPCTSTLSIIARGLLDITCKAYVICVPFLGDNCFLQEFDQGGYPHSLRSHANYSSQNLSFTHGPYPWIFVQKYQTTRVVRR